MSWRVEIQNATPKDAKSLINGDEFALSDKSAPPYAKRHFAAIKTSLLGIVDLLPKQGMLISIIGGGHVGEDGGLSYNITSSTVVVPKNQYSLYGW